MKVVVLAGGTGGAKLAAGLQALIGADLTVIANSADDCEVHGLLVCPDPDLVTYWLADQIDERRGWGIRDDTFTVHERLASFGAPDWFSLSDRDLAACLYRTHFIAEGGTITAAQAQIARGLGVKATVLPMCEQPVRTIVNTPAGPRGLQEYLIVDQGAAPITGVALDGIADAEASPESLAALGAADLIVIGPSNPVISIGPILALKGIREAIASSQAPVIAVSPFVAGRAIKGPTEPFMAAIGAERSAAGVASLYQGLIDTIVVDDGDAEQEISDVKIHRCRTLMHDAAGRKALAKVVLDLASGPGGGV